MHTGVGVTYTDDGFTHVHRGLAEFFSIFLFCSSSSWVNLINFKPWAWKDIQGTGGTVQYRLLSTTGSSHNVLIQSRGSDATDGLYGHQAYM